MTDHLFILLQIALQHIVAFPDEVDVHVLRIYCPSEAPVCRPSIQITAKWIHVH